MPIHTRTIPYALVAADALAIKNTQDTSHPSSRSQRFSTAHHHASEILPLVPEHEHFKHSPPPWTPYGYVLWHPLIAKSQRLQDDESFVGRMPGFLWEDLMRCHSAWVATNRIPQSLVNELVAMWTITRAGREIAKLFDGERKWFVRLDQMSPKDSPLGGKLPSTTLEEVVTKICSSMRAYGCLQREVEDAKEAGREVQIKIVVNRWDGGMDAGREFRVFVPPPLARLKERGLESLTAGDMRISAASQYRWPFPFVPPYADVGLKETAERVYAGAQMVLQQILEYAEKELEREIWGMLLEFGFSFDVIVKEGSEVQLVEINPFGALSGCGACLFNWAIDGKVLYGLEGDDVEFVVTLEEDDTA